MQHLVAQTDQKMERKAAAGCVRSKTFLRLLEQKPPAIIMMHHVIGADGELTWFHSGHIDAQTRGDTV